MILKIPKKYLIKGKIHYKIYCLKRILQNNFFSLNQSLMNKSTSIKTQINTPINTQTITNFNTKTFKMKKKFLFIFTFSLVVVSLAKAQEATTYRGAFAPAPTVQWTDSWANFNPQNTPYGTGLPRDTVVGVIGNFATPSTTTWTKDRVIILKGPVYLDSLCTLVIQPGTIIQGNSATVISSLIIQRGATLIANGTPCEPIVFTSNKAVGSRLAGDWGGITILGRARTNQGTNVNIEGIGVTEPRARYGGVIDTDNSGSLKYVRIEYAGFPLTPGNELNSLTLGGVGSGTTVDFIQVSFGNDDSYEWFGGTVNCKHLIAYRGLDDDFDTDFGYSGLVQFGLAIKDPTISDDPNATPSSTSEGWESDNNNFNSPNFGGTPQTSARFYNITQIGAYRCGTNLGGITNPTATNNGHRRGARIRRNSAISIFNSILMNNFTGLFIENAPTQANYNAGTLQFKNNIIAMDSTFTSTVTGTTTINGGLSKPGQDVFTTNALYTLANTNTILNTPCDLLTNAWDFLNADYRPNGSGSGAALTGSDLQPAINVGVSQFPNTTPQTLSVDLFELGVGNTNGTITLTLFVPNSFTVVPLANSDWTFSVVGNNVIATSKPGVVIALGAGATLDFTISRKAGQSSAVQNFIVGVSGGSDINATNNESLASLVVF